MGDFIKDLNIIDFLGMLLPGAFVALCLSIQHPGAWQILETAIGCELSLSLRITVVLVVGYVIGMLLHELGDRMEKCLWLVPVLNPRLYAALEARGKANQRSNQMESSRFLQIL